MLSPLCGEGAGNLCNIAVHVSDRKPASLLNFPPTHACVRPSASSTYHSTDGLWVQQPPPPPLPSRPRPLLHPRRGLHFPARPRCCWCACFSFPCRSSGWALYTIRTSSVNLELTQRPPVNADELHFSGLRSRIVALPLWCCSLLALAFYLCCEPRRLHLGFNSAPTATLESNKLQ